MVIKLGSSFSKIKLIDENIIQAGSAALDKRISNFGKENSIGQLEFLSCIPGSIGGAVVMNSGCYGADISKILISIEVIDIENCIEKEIKHDDIKFFYRGVNLSKKLIITSVKLKGKSESKDIIEKIQNDMILKKKITQPSQIKKHVVALLKMLI